MAMSQWTSTWARWSTAGTPFKRSINQGTEVKPQATMTSHTFASTPPSAKWCKKVSLLCCCTTSKASKLRIQRKWCKLSNLPDSKTIKKRRISWWSTSREIGSTNVRGASCSRSNLEIFTQAACTMDCLVWFATKRLTWQASRWWCLVMAQDAQQACLC